MSLFAARPFAQTSTTFLAAVIRLKRRRRIRDTQSDANLSFRMLEQAARQRRSTLAKRRARYFKTEEGQDKYRHKAHLSPWNDYLEKPEADVEGSLLNDEFRRKFRIPKVMFNEIMQETRNNGLFLDDQPEEGEKRRGASALPLALKVLAVLRLLALGVPVDGLCDSARLGRSTLANDF